MNVLITGITGFIGSRLASRLVRDGYNVHGLVRHTSERELSRIKEVISQVRLIEGDLGTFHSVLSAVEASEPEIIFHLGALTPVRLSFDDPYPYIATNFEGTVNLVHAILGEAPNSRLIAASTAEVYGWQYGNKPIAEDALLSKMLAGETCYVGAPDSIRDYMFAEDHVSAYVLAAKSAQAVGQVYNVSPGNPVTNSELAKMLTQMTGYTGKIVFGSYPPGYPQRPKSQDPQYLVLDNSKISKELDWKPSHTLQEGLKLTVKMWNSKNG